MRWPRQRRGCRRTAERAGWRPPVAVADDDSAVTRLQLPRFLYDLVDGPDRRRVLVVAGVSMAAAGLNPQVLSPSLQSVQTAIREQPQSSALVLVATLTAAALLFVGGILGDTDGRRRILLGALAALLVACLVGLFVPDGALFVVSRLAGAAAAYAVLPFALALVATTYQGVARATA